MSLYANPRFANDPRWLWEFVVARGGREALVRLIQANGDTASVLGLSPQAFEETWYAFVRERYLP